MLQSSSCSFFHPSQGGSRLSHVEVLNEGVALLFDRFEKEHGFTKQELWMKIHHVRNHYEISLGKKMYDCLHETASAKEAEMRRPIVQDFFSSEVHRKTSTIIIKQIGDLYSVFYLLIVETLHRMQREKSQRISQTNQKITARVERLLGGKCKLGTVTKVKTHYAEKRFYLTITALSSRRKTSKLRASGVSGSEIIRSVKKNFL